MRVAVVVSTWEGSPPQNLLGLWRSFDQYPAGEDFTPCVSANDPGYCLPPTLEGRVDQVVRRENRGFNLGAWDHAWRLLTECDRFLFLQDDCYARRANWLRDFVRCFDRTPRCGLVGEYLNRRWNRAWADLERVGQYHDDLRIEGVTVSRARYYRDVLARWGLPAGETARHLTSVVHFTSRAVLEEVGGYDVGETYHEAIAAEIGFSRKIEARGYRLVQIGPRRHSRIGHRQWSGRNPPGRFRHLSTRLFSRLVGHPSARRR